MLAMSLEKVTGCLGLDCIGRGEITSVSTHSREIKPGGLFVAVKGERADGHDYVNEAFANGAAAALCEREITEAQGLVIYVPDAARALGDIARCYFEAHRPGLVVGITGSVGKTTTKDYCASVLSQSRKTLKSKGNFNNHIGLPLTVFELEDHEAAVFEMGMSAFGEISWLTSIVRPDIAVITNIGISHAEMLGSREGILRAKSEIFEGLMPGGYAVINGDDVYLTTLAGRTGAREIFYGIEGERCDIRAENIREDEQIIGFETDIGGGRRVDISCVGRHNIYNILPACAVGALAGIAPEAIKQGIESCETADMRLQIFTCGGVTYIKDCYNASPDSMEAALDVLNKMNAGGGRKIAVLGDMRELGSFTEDQHKKIGALAARVCDRMFFIGQYAGLYLEGAEERTSARAFEDTESAVDALREFLRPGDIALFKASRSVRLERVIDNLVESGVK